MYVPDLSNIPYHLCEIFDDVDDVYWFNEPLTKQVIDEHAPLKKKITRNNQTPLYEWSLAKGHKCQKYVQNNIL